MAEEKNLPDTQKKGRGRPKKAQTEVVNEEVKQVIMSQINSEVGDVKASTIPKLSMGDVNERWKGIFSKYSSLVTYDQMQNVYINNITALNNPFIQNARVKKINTPIKEYTKNELRECVSNPEEHEQDLRAISLYLYYTNYIYQTLIRLNRETPMYKYCYSPVYISTEDSDSVKKESVMVDKILKKFDPKLTWKTIATQVMAEGKCSYLVRTSYNKKSNDVDFVLLQKVNSDNIKITGFGSRQKFTTMFDMTIFLEAGYSVSQYPEFIRKAWDSMQEQGIIITDKRGRNKLNPKASLPTGHILENYEKGRYHYWIPLPQSLCWTFYSDGISPDAFPDAVGMFEDFNELENYRWLQGNLLSRGVNSILTAEVPLTKDAKAGSDATIVSPDSILGFTDMFNSLVSENVTGFFAPFDNYKLHAIDSQPQALDIIYDRVRDLIATSANSALLPISEKPSIASVKAAQAIQASKSEYLTKQFETCLNDIINENFEMKNTWKVSLYGDIFNWKDDFKAVKEMVGEGARGLIPKMLGYLDSTIEDYKGVETYLDILGVEIKSNAQILAEKNAEINNELRKEKEKSQTNPVGRPKLNDNDVENDNTGTSNDMGNNVSDIK